MSDKILQPQRKQTSVTIEGIDTSTPDDLVKDGKCQELHNVRIKDGAWRPVNMHKILHDVASTMGEDFLTQYQIVYHHPAAGEHSFIVLQEVGAEYTYFVLDLQRKEITPFTTEYVFLKTEFSYAHLGNVLIITHGTDSYHYIYTDGKYQRWQKPDAPCVTPLCTAEEAIPPTHLYSDGKWVSTPGISSSSAIWALLDANGNYRLTDHIEDKWAGTLAFFTVYRMEDGSYISVSPIGLLSSETVVNTTDTYAWNKAYINDSYYYGIVAKSTSSSTAALFKQPQLFANKYFINISVPQDLPIGISSVALFTTRIYPPFRNRENVNIVESIFSELSDIDYRTHFNDVKFPEEPFYLCKEIPISEFTDGIYEFELTYNLLSDITSKRLYTPLNNIHDHSAHISIDYNNRLHLANYSTQLHKPNEVLPLMITEGGESVDVEREVVASLKIDDVKYNVASTILVGRNPSIDFIDGYKSIISYPDYRCEELLIVQRQKNLTDPTYAIRQLTPAVNNNFAYYIVPDSGKLLAGDTLRYTPLSYNQDVLLHDINSASRITFNNKVIVSQPNNPFAFDFANTYAIGSDDSTVLTLQSAAIEMSDAKYGEYPLYAFTTDGIYALQSGENTLYSSVLPINYDKITNKDVLAINYNLVYITSKGVHILNGKGSTLISAPLNDLAGHPLTLLNEVKLLNPESFNEVVLYHEPSSKAYIYNLDFGYWSTRDMSGAVINDGKIVDDRYILDATEEDVQRTPAECKILTRPIKLGDLEFKRLETIIPRISFLEKDTTEFNFLVQGSNNPSVDWTALRCYHATFDKQGLYPIILRRTPFSSKYIRFAMDATNKDGVGDFTIANVDFEYYHKFLRRMR